ncbi:cupredoxin domain-containing protein [Candidatus Woesearchaeota archaeon]|nr:cupredoxin domain-containing protein [Candidatus Woesearchaeota archaeon]
MKKILTTVALVMVSVILLASLWSFLVFPVKASDRIITGNDGTVQEVKLWVSNGQYVMEPSVFKQGVKVRMTADVARMPGCSKSVTIPSFGISKYVSEGNNVIEFIPTKTGTFRIACSMNMYRGTFTVSEGDAAAPQQPVIQGDIPAGAGCGGGSGGCGCGGAR